MSLTPSVQQRARKGERTRALSLWYAQHPGWRPEPKTQPSAKEHRRREKLARHAKRKSQQRAAEAASKRKQRDAWLHRNAKRLREQPTEPEVRMRELLAEWGVKGFAFQRVFGEYIPDFRCRRLLLIVEVDGAFHQNDPRQREYDARRTAYFGRFGYRVIRFTNAEVMQTPEHVGTALKAAMAEQAKAKR